MIDGFEPYERARSAVLRIREECATAGLAEPSDYWAEELSNIDYMIEASPLIIRKLRHHAFQITGIRPYDYRIDDDAAREAFVERLHSLIELGGSGLVVAEHEALGGFGYRLPEGLFNVDTLKFLEVIVGMKMSGALDILRASDRPTVLEIGAGWGGLAYQLATLIPGLRYVIVDFPELFLFSATYLQAVFPSARIAFVTPGSDPRTLDTADFVFVPHMLTEHVRSCTPDIVVNIASFQEMTSEQVTAYAKLAHDVGAPMLYSLNRERSRYNTQLSSVSARVAPYYDLADVTVLETPYTHATKKAPKRKAGASKKPVGEDLAYRHMLGRRREHMDAALPIVAIGATLHNRATHLRTALDSILTQTYWNFRLVLVDDGSSDETERIGREYQARDSRVTYVRHPDRLGMVATWRHAFDAATADASIRYFAWASDHDVWHRRWLETLVAQVEGHDEVVLAYPHARRIDPEGRLLEKPARMFQTIGLKDVDERWKYVCRELVASGDMVYGLARVDAVRAAGVFRDVICPDRLLMAELALRGEFRQVPEELWFRRDFGGASVARQRTSLFAGARPAGGWLPPWVQHGRSLWRTYVRQGASEEAADPASRAARYRAVRRVVRYCAAYALKHHQKSTTHRYLGVVLRGAVWSFKRAKHLVLLALFYALVYSRRAYHRSIFEVATFTRRIGLR